MKTLYIECNMGAAGDMLMAALLELLPDPDEFLTRMNRIGLPGVQLERSAAVCCGVTGTRISLRLNGGKEKKQNVLVGHLRDPIHKHGHDHESDAHHRHAHPTDAGENASNGYTCIGMAEIEEILQELAVSDGVKANALAVYSRIAEAESAVRDKSVQAVHFHEVDMMDAIADIVGVCLLLKELAPKRIVVSPVNVGSGQVQGAHGILPVPTPTTAHLLRGAPIYSGRIQGELCTPTGAALLRHFADTFGGMPMMTTERIGYGMGAKEFPAVNCVRVFCGEGVEEEQGAAADIVEMACNLDDMTGEEMGFALKLLLENGALDVFLVPVQMKKSRPGQMLICLCRPEDEEKMARLILQHTTTFGLRSSNRRRHILSRSVSTVQTVYGPVRIKIGSGFGLRKSKPEYEDLAGLAEENRLSLDEIRKGLPK